MTNDEIIKYYDYLILIASAKCNSQTDAEDLASDTMLAALAYMHKGNSIEHPKTWLKNTLYHKYNDNLRKKYRSPVTVYLDEGFDISEEEVFFSSDEAARVRKELNHLSYITREVLVRLYFGNQSVADIAEGLGIPTGTVKSRLSAGRNQMKKGLETMEIKENNLPGHIYLSFGGSEGLKGEPMSLVEDDLIAQNLLILAYEKPLTISELSKAIGIPAAYIEPIIKKLVYGELMVQTNGGKVYTDFIITKPQNTLAYFKPQLDFAHKYFDMIWSILHDMSAQISQMAFQSEMGSKERTKLDRYAVLKALQDFQLFGTDKIEPPKFPNRSDGGRWFAQAVAYEAGYNMKENNEASEYVICGGHRTTQAFVDGGRRRVCLFEFDTTLWDSPHRFSFDSVLYFKHIIPLLWYIYTDVPIKEKIGVEIPEALISNIPTLEKLGVIGYTQNKLCVKIPVLNRAEYDKMHLIINSATERIKSGIGEDFSKFISSMKTAIPRHLTSVPELFRYNEATGYFVMAIVREAYSKGLHLKDVDYCCPPMVLTYDCIE